MRRTWHRLDAAVWAVARRPGQGRPVLLLHGFTGTGLDFEPLLGAFAGRPLLAPDLPGHGRTAQSDRPPACDFETVRRGLRALVEAASPALAPDVLGYSMGGRLALDAVLAGALPVHRLVLVGATSGLESEDERAARRLADATLASQVEALGTRVFLARWQAQPLFARLRERVGAAAWGRMQRRRAAADAAGLAAALRGLGTGSMPDHGPDLTALPCPLLCLAGAEDTKFAQIGRTMAARAPAGLFEAVPGAGHAAHLEQSADCVARVRAFLSEPGEGPQPASAALALPSLRQRSPS